MGNAQFANFFKNNSVVGGELAGTYYSAVSPSSYSLYGLGGYGANFVFAFGKNPLNTLSTFSGTIIPSSYLTFSNGQTLSIIGGQLALTRYTLTSGNLFNYTGGRFLAIGNSPYNNQLSATISPKELSFLELATSKLK